VQLTGTATPALSLWDTLRLAPVWPYQHSFQPHWNSQTSPPGAESAHGKTGFPGEESLTLLANIPYAPSFHSSTHM